MDRSVLEADPHAVLEGMVIAAKAIGSKHGYIYCRAEYPLAIHRLNVALGQAREMGRWDVPKRWSANVQAGELEFRHEPGRRLAVLVMVMGTRISVIVWIGLYGGTVIVGVGINGSRLLA